MKKTPGSKGSSVQKQERTAVKPPVNQLYRDTPFISNIKFRCSLPEVPCDPKMLVAVLQPETLSQFNITSMEQEMRQKDLILDGGVGISLSLLDTERFAVPDVLPALDQEDAALLSGPRVVQTEGTGAAKGRERLRGDGTELSWLMRTTYIANEMQERRQQKVAEKANGNDHDVLSTDRESQLAAVEASFEESKVPPVHTRNHALTPVEILPVLPDLERWGYNHVRMAFDGEPTADLNRLSQFPPASVRAMAERAIMKSFTLGEGKEQRFVAYMLPLTEPEASAHSPDADSDRDTTEGSCSYEWVREYNYSVHNAEDHRTYWFQFADGRVTYTDLNTKLSLAKRGKHGAQDIPVPSGVNFKRRLENEAEQDARKKRLLDLTGEAGDDN